MNGTLDSKILEAIARESRQSFLTEEAPEHLSALDFGIEQLRSGDADYPTIIRAAHSLKGGAGLAGMPELSRLAHKVEDLLIALQEERVAELEKGQELLCAGMECMGEILVLAFNNQEPEAGDKKAESLIAKLDEFVESLPETSLETAIPSGEINIFLKTVLEADLEECLTTLEKNLAALSPGQAAQEHPSVLLAIANFVEEITLLGQTLNLTWLTNIALHLNELLDRDDLTAEPLTIAIAQIRSHRAEVLRSGLGDLGTEGLGDLGTGGAGDWETEELKTGGLGDLGTGVLGEQGSREQGAEEQGAEEQEAGEQEGWGNLADLDLGELGTRAHGDPMPSSQATPTTSSGETLRTGRQGDLGTGDLGTGVLGDLADLDLGDEQGWEDLAPKTCDVMQKMSGFLSKVSIVPQ